MFVLNLPKIHHVVWSFNNAVVTKGLNQLGYQHNPGPGKQINLDCPAVTRWGQGWRIFVIQIKISAEYRDMLPRPRLVCQEPGLRPIGRSPGVPDKSSRGLGSMSRYSAQILICFIAYIFSISLWVWLGTLQNCHHAQCPLPLFIVIRMRLLSAHQTIKSPSMPCWGAAGRNTLWHRTGEISR